MTALGILRLARWYLNKDRGDLAAMPGPTPQWLVGNLGLFYDRSKPISQNIMPAMERIRQGGPFQVRGRQEACDPYLQVGQGGSTSEEQRECHQNGQLQAPKCIERQGPTSYHR